MLPRNRRAVRILGHDGFDEAADLVRLLHQRTVNGFSRNLAVLYGRDGQVLAAGNAIATGPDARDRGSALVINADTAACDSAIPASARIASAGVWPIALNI